MTSEELLQKVRRIEIKTRGLSKQIFAGEYHSQFKGKGMAFSEVREYQPGDDVRSIDWNVTARLGRPYIKVFEEERELTVMLLVDVSASRNFGTTTQFKRDLITEIAATLAFSTIENNDKVGVIFFSDKIEKYIPAKKGRQHVLRIIRELIEFEPQSTGTDIPQALQYFTNAQKRRSTAFLISDFIPTTTHNNNNTIQQLEQPLLVAQNRHDLQIIQVYDPRDCSLPNIGLVKLHDPETGRRLWVDTAVTSVRQTYQDAYRNRQQQLKQLFDKTGTPNVAISTNQDFVKALLNLFHK